MSTAIRQILVFFIVVLVVKCSQSYTLSYPEAGDIDGVYEPMRDTRYAAPRGGKRSEPLPEFEEFGIMPESGTRPKEQSGFLRIGRSGFLRIGRGGPSKRQSFLRIGRGSPDDEDTEDESYIRMGRAMEADKRAQFLRIGRSSAPDQDNSGYIRMGRPMGGDLDSSFLRIGRGQPQLLQSGEQAPMMAARSSRPKRVKTPEPSFLRFGRSAPVGEAIDE